MTLLHDDLIDGVRTIWVDSGRPTLAATLLFRAGMADESLATSGWLHLVEHLALHGRDTGTLHVNGSVSALVTTFVLHGPAEEVVAALGDVTRWLSEPRTEELERERRVLLVEEASRGGGGPAGRAFGMRYGARGPGLISSGAPGLGRASSGALTDLARRYLTAGNAALALDGPPPAGLALHLAGGDRVPPPPAIAVEHSRSWYVEPAGLVLSGVVPRSAAHTLLAPVLEDALRRQLRDRDGAAYSPYSLYEGVDADHALLVAGSDVSPTTAPSLLGDVISLVGELAVAGPDPAALDTVRLKLKQAYADPYNLGGLAVRGAAVTLQGMQPQQLDEILAEADEVTGESLVPGLRALRESLMVGAPPETVPHQGLRRVEQPWSVDDARGVRSINWPADPSRLLVDEHDVVLGDGHTVRRYALADVAGYLTWPDGARHLVLEDGWGVSVIPSAWATGEQVVRRLDGLVPAELHLPQPPETAPDPVARAGATQRWWIAAQRRRRPILEGLVVLLLLASVVAVVSTGQMPLHRLVIPGIVVLLGVLVARERMDD